jgi:hypothetical protein
MTVLPRPPGAITRLAAMAWRRPISLLLCGLALAVAGCGSDDGTIPPESSEQLLNLLAAAQSAVGEGECDRAKDFAQEFVDESQSLPESVDPEVAEELANAGTNLDNLAGEEGECAPETGASGLSGDTSTSTTTTTTAPEVETTTEETTTEEEPETTTIEPSNEGPPEQTPSGQQPPSGNGGPATPGGGVEPPSGGVSGKR